MKNLAFSLAILGATGLTSLVQAAPITINNYSFETPVAAVGGAIAVTSGTSGFGWTTNANNGTINAQTVGKDLLTARQVPAALRAGSEQALRLYAAATSTPSNIAYVSQATGATLLSNTTYTLSLNIGPFATGAGVNTYSGFNVTLSAGSEFSYNVATSGTGAPSGIGELSSGSNISSASYSLTNGYNLALNNYTTLTMTIVTTAGAIIDPAALTIRIAAGTRNDPNASTIFDNVQLDAVTVPEPSVVGALSLAGLAFGAYHLRRRSRAVR